MITAEAKRSFKTGMMWVLALSVVSWLFFPWDHILPKRESAMRVQAKEMFYASIDIFSLDTSKSQVFFERQDEQGNYYFEAMMVPGFEKALPYMVDTYNNDPSTNITVTEDLIHYYLTEGISMTLGNYSWQVSTSSGETYEITSNNDEALNGFIEFQHWLGSDANLVYTKPDYYRYPNYTEDRVGYINEPGDVDPDNPPGNELMVPNVEPGSPAVIERTNFQYLMMKYGDLLKNKELSPEKFENIAYEWEYLALTE